MYGVFTKLLNMSMTSSILVLVVIVMRMVLKKVPKKYICILWAFVALRLIFPINISSSLSAFNLVENKTVSNGQIEYFQYIERAEKPQLVFDVPGLVNDEKSPDSMTIGRKNKNIYMPVISVIWLIGLSFMLIYSYICFQKLEKKTKESIRVRDNIYICDEIKTPFILGIVVPKIYLPSGLGGETMENVISHEEAHLKRLDHIWKPLGFLLLSLHWFNPLMWLAYALLSKDIESACDEKVISNMNREDISSYMKALLSCASERRLITACPVAFGETNVKGRIKNIIHFKKPAFIIICIAVATCLITAVCFLTSPKVEAKESLSDNIQKEESNQLTAEEAQTAIRNASITDQEYFNVRSNLFSYYESDKEAMRKEREKAKESVPDLFDKMQGRYWLSPDYSSYIWNISAEVNIKADGSFEGYCEDFYKENYYFCSFSGVLESPQKIDEYTYSTKVKEINYETPGLSKEVNGFDVITCSPFVWEDMPELTIYAPKTPISNLSMNTYKWISEEREEFRDKTFNQADSLILPCYIIRNDNENYVFSQGNEYDYFEDEEVAQCEYYQPSKVEEVDRTDYLYGESFVYGNNEGSLNVRITEDALSGTEPLYLVVADEKGEDIWTAQLGKPHVGWNSYYHYKSDGKDFLIEYNPYEMQGEISYRFRLFYLDEKGNEVNVTEFKADNYIEVPDFNKSVMPYLDNAQLIISTLEGIITRGMFD